MPDTTLPYQAAPPRRKLAHSALAVLVAALSIAPVDVALAAGTPLSRQGLAFFIGFAYAGLVAIAAVVVLIRLNRSQTHRGSMHAGAALALALLIGVACPGIASYGIVAAKETARNVQMAGRLDSLEQAYFAYRSATGKAPDDLADLLTVGVTPQAFLAPGSPTPPLPTGWSPSSPTRAADIAAHSDVVYTGAGLPDSSTGTIIMLYTTGPVVFHHFDSDDHYDGPARIVCYDDGRVEILRETDFPAAIARSNRERAKLGLPPITVTGVTTAPASAPAAP